MTLADKDSAVRDRAPDILRGFALLGILFVNIPFMAILSEEGIRGEWVGGFFNGTASVIMFALFAGKFYILFSFLFGYSANYIIKFDKRNRMRWIKRASVLVIFGILHFSLLWHGDILFLYGIFAFLLVPFLFRKDKTLKIWAIVLYSIFTFFLFASALSLIIAEKISSADPQLSAESSLFDEIMKTGDFLSAIGPRIDLWSVGIVSAFFLQGGFVFAAFLTGLRLGRSKYLSQPTSELRSSKAVRIGLFVGLPIEIVIAVTAVLNEQSNQTSDAIYFACIVLSFVFAPLLTRMYVVLILRVLERRPRSLMWLQPAGRMSLTVYISESVLASLIFGPWGLGLFQKVEVWMLFFIALGIWGFLNWCSTIWLRSHSQGPLESLLHLLTSGKNRMNQN